ncbi:uncharacterized protein METZ01_LOCUS497194 [marine metagenome]|uniref:Uncharacterized protein n=1 Tax=marine metagenome TaxID=408172 RepID=A0A383DJ50_9ZZZZ
MEKDVSKQKAALSTQIAKIPRLRGTGPNPFEYDRWDARTRELLDSIFGRESEEFQAYEENISVSGRLVGVRGSRNNMTLNIHGQWGILERLAKAENLLAEIVRKLT